MTEASLETLLDQWQAILDTAQLDGSILLFNPQEGRYYSNDFSSIRQGSLPASTFKIPNSIIALETGVVADDSTLFSWDGSPRRMAIWEQDLIFRQAFQFSCVPCYQDVARRIGADRMNDYLDRLAYGQMRVDTANIDRFWLEGSSAISPWEQIDFLQRLYQGQLPISDRTLQIIKRMLLIEEKPTYRLSGKTGWAIREGNNTGWFVGYAEREESVYYFATRVIPQEGRAMTDFARARRAVTEQALEHYFKLE